jgi:hypothetical protein
MADDEHLAILQRGTAEWNRWRADSPDIRPDLSDSSLSGLDLSGANLAEVNLSDAELDGTTLSDANLKMADLSGADLSAVVIERADLYKADLTGAFLIGADLTGAYLAETSLREADLRGASLRDADLTESDLSSANVDEADLTAANLTRATIRRTSFRGAELTAANLLDVEYGSYHDLTGLYSGVRGLDASYGNALFVRDAKDQDYLDTLSRRIDQIPSARHRRLRRGLFRAWGWIDYGRSLAKPAAYAIVLALAYGVLYLLDQRLDWGLLDFSTSADGWLTPFYFSIVTYTTLGFGDVTPGNWIGEIVVISEVLLGYVTLGLLLAILANKVARRA